MSELNPEQKEFAERLDGMIVVDAGPGTGKTHSVTDRYVNMINAGIDPINILMLTFTNNAAAEMKEKISTKLLVSTDREDKEAMKKTLRDIENIRASTFDSLCLNIVLNSPDSVNEFFEIDESLSRNARLVENETLNRDYFRMFYARFVKDHGDRYIKNDNNPPAIIGKNVGGLYTLICKLMARGVMPMRYDWFDNGERIVKGRTGEVYRRMCEHRDKVVKAIKEMSKDPYLYDLTTVDELDDDAIESYMKEASEEDRFLLLEFIRDVYFEYIRQSISDNRLTFGLAELFAFAVLYHDAFARSSHSVDYMMVDEFQDTNELQLKICLLLLKKPNLCVVGDWKQGIYGFRFVSKDNITDFENRADLFITQLNRNGARVPFLMPSVIPIKLKKNYRSSALILEKSFQSLEIKGNKDEEVKNDEIVALDSMNDSAYGDYTAFESIICDDDPSQVRDVVSKILEYRFSGRYKVVETDGETVTSRAPRFGDIAVLCRKGILCSQILQECNSRKIPAFFQGDIEVMSTREGKLALAWLRYVNNSLDDRGRVAILADLGYPMEEIKEIVNKNSRGMPTDLSDLREKLEKKRRRPNDLLTSIFAYYGIDNDISQTIINTLSSAYTGSLITVSDLIRLMEDDIENGTKYDVDASLDTEAVTIQTVHKSKGLEYPIVIVAGLDQGSFPSTKGDNDVLRFNDTEGIRSTKTYVSKVIDGTTHQDIVGSWRYELIKASVNPDYSEERRLLFVALTRAKQYIAITARRPSRFFTHYGDASCIDPDVYYETEMSDDVQYADQPVLDGYSKRRRSLTPHDLMELYDGYLEQAEKGEGAKHGTAVHDAAYLISKNMPYDSSLEETEEIASILDSLKGAEIRTEVGCVLPMGNTSIKGIIDLLAIFDDHVEIHDYKTDETQRLRPMYELQLSIYALAAERFYGKPAECYLDFVKRKERVRIERMSYEDIEKKVAEYHSKVHDGRLHGSSL